MTFRSAAQYPMPSSIQSFGMTRFYVFVMTYWFSNPKSAQLGGTTGWAIFGSSDDGATVYPLDDVTAAGFALPTPIGPSWREWQRRNVPESATLASPALEKALECAPIDPSSWGND
ncbi:hypothetical protein [Nocardioides baekrokdamisoli]|nr:hypothetical protein [Nocardioides baekrokdamisoli]